MIDKETLFEKEKKFHIPTYNRLPVVFVRGEDVYLWDEEGKRYVDFVAGLGVVNLGHCHPAVADAFCLQARELMHVSNLFYTIPQVELAEKLSEMSIPGGRCFFGNSGAEANEGAIKLARRYGKTRFAPERVEIITAFRSFHGRTMKTLAATGQPDKQLPFQPLPGGFKHVPYNDIDSLKLAADEKTIAVMLEVIQGEGGVYPAAPGYLEDVRRFCDDNGLLLILDEVQTGLGRTGSLFAYQRSGIVPDILTLAKGLGNGLPIGSFVAKESVASAFNYGDHGSTFGGGPAVCAAALATLNTLENDKLARRAAEIGAYFKDRLLALAARLPMISEVRGEGLMLGMEIKEAAGREIVVALLERGFIINNIGEHILRFLPPLTIKGEHIDEMMSVLEPVLGELRV